MSLSLQYREASCVDKFFTSTSVTDFIKQYSRVEWLAFGSAIPAIHGVGGGKHQSSPAVEYCKGDQVADCIGVTDSVIIVQVVTIGCKCLWEICFCTIQFIRIEHSHPDGIFSNTTQVYICERKGIN